MKTDRAKLLKRMDMIGECDTIATAEVSRLTRSTKQLCEILQLSKTRRFGCSLVSSWQTVDPMTKDMLIDGIYLGFYEPKGIINGTQRR